MEIKNIVDDGSMDAAYFNPKSIRVAKAEASRHRDAMKVFVEPRNVNNPASDQLKGMYYQAVER